MRLFAIFALGTLVSATAAFADTKVKLSDLPAAVQAAVKEQTKNATLTGLSKEVEKGKTTYEIETKVNGRTRDVVVDAAGKILAIEEQADLDKIPAGARQAIQKQATGGTVKSVEMVTEGTVVSYEAVIEKGGKSKEFAVNADGSVHK